MLQAFLAIFEKPEAWTVTMGAKKWPSPERVATKPKAAASSKDAKAATIKRTKSGGAPATANGKKKAPSKSNRSSSEGTLEEASIASTEEAHDRPSESSVKRSASVPPSDMTDERASVLSRSNLVDASVQTLTRTPAAASASASASTSAATTGSRILISWAGAPPADAHPSAVARLGSFTKQTQLVNGHACYAHEGRADTMLWCDPLKRWMIGLKENIGTDQCGVYCTQLDALLPEEITGGWEITNCKDTMWLPTDGIKVTMPSRAASADQVTITGTREERDTEGRKRAIDVVSGQEHTPAKTALETRVADARSLCDVTVDIRAEVLAQAAFKEFMTDKIDSAELERRKQAAREQAVAEHEALSVLDKAYDVYTAATVARVAARVAAEQAFETALKAEDVAASKVDEAMQAIVIEAAAAGKLAAPSGVPR